MSQTLNAPPVRLGAMREGEEITRGIDLTDALELINDTIASVTSVTVVRRDNVTPGVNDLTITPGGTQAPWITAVPYGPLASTGFVVNWWQACGASIAATGAVDYQITIVVATTAGRNVIRDCYQLVVSGLG